MHTLLAEVYLVCSELLTGFFMLCLFFFRTCLSFRVVILSTVRIKLHFSLPSVLFCLLQTLSSLVQISFFRLCVIQTCMTKSSRNCPHSKKCTDFCSYKYSTFCNLSHTGHLPLPSYQCSVKGFI